MNIIIGFFAGLTASMGLGGGFILIIYLSLISGITAQSTLGGINLLFFLPIAFVSALFHLKHKLVETKGLIIIIASGVIGAFAGTFLMSFLNEGALRKLFAVLLIFVGLRELFHKKPKNEQKSERVNAG